MTVPQSLYHLATQLYSKGLTSVYISPGSRNAPLIRAFLSAEGLKCYHATDERSAAFMAMGNAMATGKPAALLCTSGTALLNYFPAMTEAFYSGIPLLAISADRPAKLIDQWEGQCIRQMDVFNGHIGPSMLFDPTLNDAGDAVDRIFDRLKSGIPVHLNVPLDEPLYQDEFIQPQAIPSVDFKFNTGHEKMPDDFLADLNKAQSILLLNGTSLSKMKLNASPIMVFNDVVSNKWNQNGLSDWDGMFLSDPSKFPTPDLLITSGTSIISKGCRNWLRSLKGLKQWHVGTQNPVGDPFFKQPKIWSRHESIALPMILEKTASKSWSYKQGWENVYTEYAQKVSRYDFSIDSELSAMKFVFDHLPEGSSIHLANSSVVRYASWLGAHDGHKNIFANRGTSGIDGCTSTAVGFARETEDPVFLITGDVAFFYDINALFCSGEVPKNLRIVLLNNGGGGIFDLLDGPGQFEHSLPFQTTPHSRKSRLTCEDARISYQSAENLEALKTGWNPFIQSDGPALIEIMTDSKDNAIKFKEFKKIMVDG